jgi:hypothetical protein
VRLLTFGAVLDQQDCETCPAHYVDVERPDRARPVLEYAGKRSPIMGDSTPSDDNA